VRNKVQVVVLIGDAMARPLIEEFTRGDCDASSVVAISSSAALFLPAVKDQYLDALPKSSSPTQSAPRRRGSTAPG